MTRKKGKGYLRGDFRSQFDADPPNPLELVNTSERTERIAVRNNSPGESGTDPAKRLDFGSCGDVEIDDARDNWLSRRARLDKVNRPALSLAFLFRLAAVPDGIDGLDLRIERASSGSVNWSLAVEDRDAPRSRAEHNNRAEE